MERSRTKETKFLELTPKKIAQRIQNPVPVKPKSFGKPKLKNTKIPSI